MKAPGFLEGAGIALGAALAGSAIMFLLAGVVAAPLVLRGLIAALGLGYVLYLLARSRTRAGKVSLVLVWALFTAVTLALDPPLLLHLCTQVGLVWLLRAFCVHRSVLPALADCALSTGSVLAAVWAAERTGSVFMAIWCALLVQAAHVAIPRRGRAGTGEGAGHGAGHGTGSGTGPSGHRGDERFARAHRTAEAAVRRLSTVR